MRVQHRRTTGLACGSSPCVLCCANLFNLAVVILFMPLKYKLYSSLFAGVLALFIGVNTTAQTPTPPAPIAVAQAQLYAYNKQDAVAFAALFAPDVRVYQQLGDSLPSLIGRAAVQKRYADLFAKYPQNKSTLIGRMQQGNMVIDHEWITGREKDTYMIAIYEIINGLITRCWFIR